MTDASMKSDPLYSTSERSTIMLVISAGYFLHDVVTCFRNYRDWGFEYLLHASGCFLLYTYISRPYIPFLFVCILRAWR